jgi:Tfp pilus assembly PilM family ATPase
VFLPQNIFTRAHHVGLSITPYAVRAVVVEHTDKVSLKEEVLADQLLIDGENVNIAKLTEVLRQIKQKIGIEAMYAACCFPEKLAYTREHTLPAISNAEISEAVNWQLGSIFPFKPEDLYADWKLIEKNDQHVRIIISAVNRKLIDGLVASCNAAGIKPLSFESSASALARSLTGNPENAMIIELDNFGSSTTLVEKGVSSLTATTNFSSASSSQDLIADIAATISQLKKKIDNPEVPIFATGEKAVSEITEAISSQIGQPVKLLGSDQIESSFQAAYVESISTIEAPESNKTINLLPKTIEQLYQSETDIAQAKSVASYGIVVSLIAFFFSLALFITSQVLVSTTASQLSSIPEPPLPPEGVNLTNFLQKSQKISLLQSAEYFPTRHIETLLSAIGTSTLRQMSYDASKKNIKLSLVPPDRTELFNLKTALDETKLFGPTSIPLSALNSDGSENIILTLTINSQPQ